MVQTEEMFMIKDMRSKGMQFSITTWGQVPCPTNIVDFTCFASPPPLETDERENW